MARTHAELLGILRSGGSVIVNGRHVLAEADLPPESVLAADDESRRAIAAADLRARRDRLQAEIDKLEPPAPAPAHGKATPVTPQTPKDRP